MQQHDKDPYKSKHKLANTQRESTYTLRCWYDSCVGHRTNTFAVKFVNVF